MKKFSCIFRYDDPFFLISGIDYEPVCVSLSLSEMIWDQRHTDWFIDQVIWRFSKFRFLVFVSSLFSVVSTPTSTIITTRSCVISIGTKCDCCHAHMFCLLCLLFLLAIRTLQRTKEQIEDGLLVSPPKTHSLTQLHDTFFLYWRTGKRSLFFIPHKILQIQKMLKSSFPFFWSYTYYGAEFRISGRVSIRHRC